MIRRTPDKARLYEIAESQQGFFTTKQAKACGYAENTHPYHVRCGHWIREQRRICRLAFFPASDEEQYVIWALWSMDRQERPQGVYSHVTALALHDLSDVMPNKLHLTVPKRFRRFRETPGVLVLHKADLAPSEVEARRGFSVTTPSRTLCDVAADETIPDELIQSALRDGIRTGLVSRTSLLRDPSELPERLRRIVEQERRS